MKTPAGHLREDGVKRVRELRAQGKTYQEIADDLGISVNSVAKIVKGETWAWLTTP